MNTLLDVANVSKFFGGVHALDNVGLNVPTGSIVGLIGPNGAGKTTFFNVITGLYPAESGQFQFNWQKLFTPFNCPGNPSGYCPYVSEYSLVWGDDCLRKCDGGLSLPLAYRCLWCSYAD